MQNRMNIAKITPSLYQSIQALDAAVDASGLEPRLLHLLKIRSSQINGCSYCTDIHIRDARKDGMDMQTLYMTSAWRESPCFDARDRAVLEWTEHLTQIAELGVPHELYERVKALFSEEEIAKLIVAIGMINLWNRIGVSAQLIHPRKP
ncbi:carboxymuconolactone decarboxylase family protein [Pseudochrobactrum kiredjianiae]|uniref:Carboxymuconolactone decarboxylase family protein n=1 Tax=Pseudochrobactrum kiredjianiae TaxID=386305 RepID=A0ABW3V4K7_9HYPH|nr:carboxymuconolactone decarboxylase family protein [Pseudochrobactrum kiredjianiae]MDM7851729.1 carboxymuconolactone decarboxylase family protein [Pseudochrobactrum kiredjianiae]